MAFNMKLQVASVLIVAVMFALYSASGVSCQKEGEPSVEQTKQPLESGATAAANKGPLAGLPMIVVRQTGGKPDIYLGWLNWDGLSFLKPFLGTFTQQIQPFTQEMSGMLLNTVPGASSIFTQFDQMGNQISALNPFSQILGSLGGSGSGSGSSGSGSGAGLSGLPGLSGLSGLFGRRR